MATGQGFKTALVVGEESSYGIGAASTTPNAWKMPIVKPGLKGSQNLIASKALLNDPNPRAVAGGNRTPSGSVDIELSPKSLGWWLKWFFGSSVASTAAGTGATYTITGAQTAGATVLALTGGTGTLPVNTWVKIVHSDTTFNFYRINTSTGSPVTSVTIDGGLMKATSAGAAITVVASSYGHKFNLDANSAPPSLFAELQHSDLSTYHLFNGLYLDKLALKLVPEGIASATASLEGKDFSLGTSSTAVTGTITDPGNPAFNYFGAAIFQGGSLLGIVKEMDIELNANRDKGQYVIDNTGTRNDIPAGIRTIGGSIRVNYTGDTLMTLANAGTATTLRVFLRDTGGNSAFQLYFPEVRLKPTTEEVVSEAVCEANFEFVAYYGTNAEATSVQATLLNTQAAYTTM